MIYNKDVFRRQDRGAVLENKLVCRGMLQEEMKNAVDQKSHIENSTIANCSGKYVKGESG